ncbi:hypothetical protein D3C81_2279690 [compost metagenome]
MVVDQRLQLVGFPPGHVFQNVLVLVPDFLQLFFPEHVQPAVADIVNIGLLNQVP